MFKNIFKGLVVFNMVMSIIALYTQDKLMAIYFLGISIFNNIELIKNDNR